MVAENKLSHNIILHPMIENNINRRNKNAIRGDF